MKIILKEKTPIIISYSLCKYVGTLILGQNAGAFAFFPFIVVRDTKILYNDEYIRHEKIHLIQYRESLFVGILLFGFLQYIYARVVLRKTKIQAYYYMSHEQEAHQNDTNPQYFKQRKLFSYYKYFLSKNKKQISLIDGKRVIS
jgi:hypothetical protein